MLVKLLLGLVALLLGALGPRLAGLWRDRSLAARPLPRAHAHPLYVLTDADDHFRAALAAAACPDEVRRLPRRAAVLCCVYVHPELAWAPHWDRACRATAGRGLISHGLSARLRVLAVADAPAAPLPAPATPDPGVLAGPGDLVTTALRVAGPNRNALAAWRLAVWLARAGLDLAAAPHELAFLAGHGAFEAPAGNELTLAWQEARALAWPPERPLPPLPHLLQRR